VPPANHQTDSHAAANEPRLSIDSEVLSFADLPGSSGRRCRAVAARPSLGEGLSLANHRPVITTPNMLARFLRQPLRTGSVQPLAVRAAARPFAPALAPAARLAPLAFARPYSDGPVLTREFVLERVSDVLANCSKIDAAKITPQARLEEDVGLDSLDVVDFLFYIEEEFTIEMPDRVVAELKTVQDVADFVFKQPDAF